MSVCVCECVCVCVFRVQAQQMLCACQEKIDVSNTEGYDLFITQLKEGVKNTSHETAANHKVAKVSHVTRLPRRNPDVLFSLLCVVLCCVCPDMLERNRQLTEEM